jgi:hypothetical protein
MATMSNTGNIKKIIFLFFLIIFLFGLSIIVLDFAASYFGIYLEIPVLKDLKEMTIKKKLVKNESPILLEKEELSKDTERHSITEEQLKVKEKELELKSHDIDKKLDALKDKERELEKKNSLLEDRDNKFKNIQQNIKEQAVKLYNMPPESSVAILEKQSEADIVDILRAIDKYSDDLGRNSLSPYYLTLLAKNNPDKAGVVVRMIKYPTGSKNTTVESLEDSQTPVKP